MIRTEITKVYMREGVKGTWHLTVESDHTGYIIDLLSGTEDEVRAKKIQLERFLLRSH